MANYGIIDADLLDKGTRHPNLALMKISGFYKNHGNKISLLFIHFIYRYHNTNINYSTN